MQRILWIKGGALGDFIVALPVLAALRRAFPGARIEALGPDPWLPLATGWADALGSIDGLEWTWLYSDHGPLPERLKSMDLAVVLRPDPDETLHRNLRRAGVGRVLVRNPVPPGGLHIVDHLSGVLAPLQIPVEPRPRVLHPATDHPRDMTVVYLHPGSGGVRKRWPAERFLALAEALRARGLDPRVILGPIELELGEAGFWHASGFAVLEAPPLWSLAGHLARAGLFVGNDSGIGHLAAAVGCPTLALFGPTDPSVWAPRGPIVRVVHGATGSLLPGSSAVVGLLEALPVEVVLAAADELLASMPRLEA